MSDTNRDTDITPPPIETLSDRKILEAVLGELRGLRADTEQHRGRLNQLDGAIANPPWLPRLVEIATTASAALEVRETVRELESTVESHAERIAALEAGCVENHGYPVALTIPPSNGGG